MAGSTKPQRAKRTLRDVDAPAKRDPSESEKLAIERARETRKNRPARVALDQLPNERNDAGSVLRLASQHNDEDGFGTMLVEALGTRSGAFTDVSIKHLANLTANNGEPSIDGINASLAIIGAVDPKDELEAVLATQIAATHDMSMAMLSRAKSAKYLEHVRDYGNLATKLQRTMATMVKTLSDHRRGGVQEVIHRHIHVYEGGQAVVAEHITLGGSANGNHAHNAHAQLPPMWGALPDASRCAMPQPGDEERAMQDARRIDPKRGGTSRQHQCDEARGSDTQLPGDDG